MSWHSPAVFFSGDIYWFWAWTVQPWFLHRKRETSEMFNGHVSCVMGWQCRGAPNIQPAFPPTFAKFWSGRGGWRTGTDRESKSPHILPVHTKESLPRSHPSCSQSPQDICSIFEIVWLRAKDLSLNLSKAELDVQGGGDRNHPGSLSKTQRNHNQGPKRNKKWTETRTQSQPSSVPDPHPAFYFYL